ncbi:MAG: ABC transporter substrate-binding protein [Dehalococcoidia bacterium]
MGKKGKTGLLFGLVLIIIALPLIACGGPAEPVEEKVLRIAWGWDMTNGAASTGLPAVKAAQAYTNYLNDEKGGIGGIRVELLWADTAYKADRAVAAYANFKARGMLSLSAMAAHEVAAVIPMATRDQIPVTNISPSFDTMVPTANPWAFSPYPMIGDGFTAFMMWLKAEGKTPAKVALLGWDSPYGRMAERTAERFAGEFGVEVVAIQVISPRATEAASQLTALAKENPDYIFITTVEAPAGMILKEAKRMGLTDKIQFVGNHWDAGQDVIKYAGEDVVDGFIGIHPLVTYEEEVPGVVLAKKLMQKYEGEFITSSGYLIGLTNIHFMWAAVEDALAAVGYENMSGVAVKDALENFKDRDMLGISPPITITPDDHRGPFERVLQWQGGKRIPISDWIATPLPK